MSASLTDLGLSERNRVELCQVLEELGAYYDSHDLDPPSEVLLADPNWIAITQRVGEALAKLA